MSDFLFEIIFGGPPSNLENLTMNIVCLVCVLQQYLFAAAFPEGTKELLWLTVSGWWHRGSTV